MITVFEPPDIDMLPDEVPDADLPVPVSSSSSSSSSSPSDGEQAAKKPSIDSALDVKKVVMAQRYDGANAVLKRKQAGNELKWAGIPLDQ